jgi:hypothetical protein
VHACSGFQYRKVKNPKNTLQFNAGKIAGDIVQDFPY